MWINPAPPDTRITAVIRRFWWPVYAGFRDGGSPPETSLHHCHTVVGANPDRILQGLRQTHSRGRLRCWMENEIHKALQGHPPDLKYAPPEHDPLPVTLEEAQSREPLRLATRPSRKDPRSAFHQRWALVLLETTLTQLMESTDDPIVRLEREELLGYLDRPLPSGPINDFAGWIQSPQILGLKRRFWSALRETVNTTITDPRILEIELLELFPPR